MLLKRLTAILICVCLSIAMIPTFAFAATDLSVKEITIGGNVSNKPVTMTYAQPASKTTDNTKFYYEVNYGIENLNKTRNFTILANDQDNTKLTVSEYVYDDVSETGKLSFTIAAKGKNAPFVEYSLIVKKDGAAAKLVDELKANKLEPTIVLPIHIPYDIHKGYLTTPTDLNNAMNYVTKQLMDTLGPLGITASASFVSPDVKVSFRRTADQKAQSVLLPSNWDYLATQDTKVISDSEPAVKELNDALDLIAFPKTIPYPYIYSPDSENWLEDVIGSELNDQYTANVTYIATNYEITLSNLDDSKTSTKKLVIPAKFLAAKADTDGDYIYWQSGAEFVKPVMDDLMNLDGQFALSYKQVFVDAQEVEYKALEDQINAYLSTNHPGFKVFNEPNNGYNLNFSNYVLNTSVDYVLHLSYDDGVKKLRFYNDPGFTSPAIIDTKTTLHAEFEGSTTAHQVTWGNATTDVSILSVKVLGYSGILNTKTGEYKITIPAEDGYKARDIKALGDNAPEILLEYPDQDTVTRLIKTTGADNTWQFTVKPQVGDEKSYSVKVVIGKPVGVIESITIDPTNANAAVGDTVQFTKTVVALNGAAEDVDWIVTRNNDSIASSTIDSNGLLTIAAGDAGKTLKVTVTSKFDSNKSATAKVIVGKAATYDRITVTPDKTTVDVGGTVNNTALVVGSDNPSQDVTWTVTGGSSTITDAGVLTIVAADAGKTLTVTATSKVDTTVSGSATVTVNALPAPVIELVTLNTGLKRASVTNGTADQTLYVGYFLQSDKDYHYVIKNATNNIGSIPADAVSLGVYVLNAKAGAVQNYINGHTYMEFSDFYLTDAYIITKVLE